MWWLDAARIRKRKWAVTYALHVTVRACHDSQIYFIAGNGIHDAAITPSDHWTLRKQSHMTILNIDPKNAYAIKWSQWNREYNMWSSSRTIVTLLCLKCTVALRDSCIPKCFQLSYILRKKSLWIPYFSVHQRLPSLYASLYGPFNIHGGWGAAKCVPQATYCLRVNLLQPLIMFHNPATVI